MSGRLAAFGPPKIQTRQPKASEKEKLLVKSDDAAPDSLSVYGTQPILERSPQLGPSLSADSFVIPPLPHSSSTDAGLGVVFSPSSSSLPVAPPDDDHYPEPDYFMFEFILICLALNLSETSRGLVIPTLNEFVESLGGNSLFLSFVVAVFSLGRLISSLVYGYMADHNSLKQILFLTFSVMTIGNFTYILSERIESKALLIFSRMLSGFGTGVLTVARSYVGSNSRGARRINFLSWLGIVQFIGFGISPIVGGLTIYVEVGRLELNTYTFGTAILFCVNVAILIIIAVKLEHRAPPPSKKKSRENQSNDGKQVVNDSQRAEIKGALLGHQADSAAGMGIGNEIISSGIGVESEPNTPGILDPHNTQEQRLQLLAAQETGEESSSLALSLIPPPILAPCVLVCLNGFCRGIIAIVETFGAKLYGEVRGDKDNPREAQQAGIYFGILGTVGVLVYMSLSRLTKRFGDQPVLIWGLIVPAVGLCAVVFVPISAANLISLTIGVSSIWSLGAPMSQTLTVSELSKYLKDRKQGVWMGVITAAGSIGRFLLPLGAGWAYTSSGELAAWSYCLGLCWLCVAQYMLLVIHPTPAMRVWRWFERHWPQRLKCWVKPFAEKQENRSYEKLREGPVGRSSRAVNQMPIKLKNAEEAPNPV
jgi:MFS family permease